MWRPAASQGVAAHHQAARGAHAHGAYCRCARACRSFHAACSANATEPQPQSKAERFKSTLEMLDRGGPDAEKMRTQFRSTQGFCDQRLASWLPGCGAWHHCSVPCEEAHRFPFHANAAAFLDRMGGKVYIKGHAAPAQGALTADAFVARAQQRDAYGRHVYPDVLQVDSESGRTFGGWSHGWEQAARAT